MTLRPYRAEDWTAVSQIYDLSKPDELFGVVRAAEIPALEVDPAMQKLFRESQITVAEDRGTIVGFGGYRDSFITWLFVHPSFRRRGVASALIRHMLAILQGPVLLNVVVTNASAISLYQHLGFVVEHEFLTDFQGHPCKAARLRCAGAT